MVETVRRTKIHKEMDCCTEFRYSKESVHNIDIHM